MDGRKLGRVLIGLVSALSRNSVLDYNTLCFRDGYLRNLKARIRPYKRATPRKRDRIPTPAVGLSRPSDRVDELFPGATRPRDNCPFGADKLSVHKVFICGALLSQQEETFSMLVRTGVMILPCR